MESIAFFVLAVAAVAAALLVVSHRNPFVCALALAVNLVSVAGFYMLLNAQFIALLQVIVYTGAILVLILFVVMLLNLQEESRGHPAGTFQRWLAPLFGIAFAILLGRAMLAGSPIVLQRADADYGTAASVGKELFGRFFYPFEVISLLLVAAMIGAVVLAKRKV